MVAEVRSAFNSTISIVRDVDDCSFRPGRKVSYYFAMLLSVSHLPATSDVLLIDASQRKYNQQTDAGKQHYDTEDLSNC
jgi:hypothetical protein